MRVITFGTYDVFHLGHLRLLQRAAALGDALIVGVLCFLLTVFRGKQELNGGQFIHKVAVLAVDGGWTGWPNLPRNIHQEAGLQRTFLILTAQLIGVIKGVDL